MEKPELVEKERQSGNDQKEERPDENPVLEALGEVHPQENLVVSNEGRVIHGVSGESVASAGRPR